MVNKAWDNINLQVINVGFKKVQITHEKDADTAEESEDTSSNFPAAWLNYSAVMQKMRTLMVSQIMTMNEHFILLFDLFIFHK